MIAGTIVTLIGLSILTKALFKIDIPLMRIALGLFFVYLGAKFIMGERSWKWTEISEGKGASAIFSSLNLKFNEGEKPQKSYSSICGSTRIIIVPGTPVEVQSFSVFDHAQLPDDSHIAVGTQVYRSESTKNSKHRLIIKTNTVFGSFELVHG